MIQYIKEAERPKLIRMHIDKLEAIYIMTFVSLSDLLEIQVHSQRNHPVPGRQLPDYFPHDEQH